MVRTGIFKAPVTGPVRVNALNIAGDRQADLTVRNGVSKAIYAYPSEHYEFWRKELPNVEFPWGGFGENPTTEGLLEKKINSGDRLCAGSVEFLITKPRLPCYKLGMKLGRDDMVKRFLKSRRSGFYCAVGETAIQFLIRDPSKVTVAEVTRLYAFDRNDSAGLRRASEAPALPESRRIYFRERLGL